MTRNASIAVVMVAGLLQGCGFSPLYGSGTGSAVGAGELGSINVALIPDRAGQELRQDLQEALESGASAAGAQYDLYVTVSIAESDVAINQQTASTRARDTGTASWVLRTEGEKHAEIASGVAHALDGYDIINQQFFAADMSREAAIRRIDQTLAGQITQQLAVYFDRRRSRLKE